ncbi:hypothetical protein RDABS01_037154 [Bienertia sinuspersici]
MADSEKGNSSTKEAKSKTSLLDEDFSKDFLNSWKPMSGTKDDDIDFNFEPVSKGKKKAFDFGMDMDFSLDDAFGKMSSFKIDLPDLDFSTSPKKPSLSKEKPEEDSTKKNHLDKHDKFNFSFDFDGQVVIVNVYNSLHGFRLDDFSLDAPSAKGEKSPRREKKNKTDGSECDDFPRQVTNDKKETAEDSISKGPAVIEDATFSRSEDLVVGDLPTVNCASESILLPYPLQQKENQIPSDEKLAENFQKTEQQHCQEEEASSKKCYSPRREGTPDPVSVDRPPQPIGLSMPIKSAEVGVSSTTEKTEAFLSTDDESKLKEEEASIHSHTHLKEMDLPTNTPLLEASVQANVSEALTISSPERKVNDGSNEDGIVPKKFSTGADLTLTTEKPILDKSAQECSTDKKNNDEMNKLDNNGGLDKPKRLVDTVEASAVCDTKTLSSSARSGAEMPKPSPKVASTLIGSEPTAAESVLIRNEVPGAINSKFSVAQATSDGGRSDHSAYEDNKEGSTHVGAVDKSYGGNKHNEKKSDNSPSTCAKESMKPDTVLNKSEKIAAAHTPPRDQEDTVDGKNRNEMSVNSVSSDEKEAKSGLSSLRREKMINNVKSSSFKISSLSPTAQGTNFGNQRLGKLKGTISSISSIQKLNICQGNKLSSQRVEKKMPALPSLKLTRSTTTDKQVATCTKQRNSGTLGNFEKSSRLQAATKTVPPVSAEKQTPSTLSLKRKSSEAADMGPEKLHTPKRFSPYESRMPEVSAREPEDRAKKQGNFLEGSRNNVSVEYTTPKLDFEQEANLEAMQFSVTVENDENVEKAEACAKELDNICNMLKKKHEEAKELLVRALVNNNHLLMLNHPIYEEKISLYICQCDDLCCILEEWLCSLDSQYIRAVERLASRLMTKELEVEA